MNDDLPLLLRVRGRYASLLASSSLCNGVQAVPHLIFRCDSVKCGAMERVGWNKSEIRTEQNGSVLYVKCGQCGSHTETGCWLQMLAAAVPGGHGSDAQSHGTAGRVSGSNG